MSVTVERPRTFKRKFVVSRETYRWFADHHSELFEGVNAQKIGKHRRGTVKLQRCSSDLLGDTVLIVLTFAIAQTPFFRVQGTPQRFQLYRYTDYRKVLRRLATK
jgi:hypothetical protein